MSERIMKVLANVAQGLTEEEKLQARTNIGAIGGVKVADSSGTTELVPDENGKVTVDLTNVGGVPSFSGSDNGLVLGVVGSSDPELQWVSKGGGGTSYTAGDGIDIDANDVISAKVDGTSIGVNASGELESLATVDQHYNASSTNAQSGTAVAEAVSGVSGVPSVGSGDDGKVLTADFTGGSGTFSWKDPPEQEQADWAQTNTSAVDFIKNKPSIPSKTSDLTNDSGFITAADEAVKDVTQNGSSVVNAQGVAEIVTRDVPSSTSSDSGKVLTVDSSGTPVWVTPSGGQSYTAGGGISISQNNEIGAKVDGTSIVIDPTTGEMSAPGGGGGSSKEFYTEYATDASDNSYVTVSNGPGLDLKVNSSGFYGRAMAYTSYSGIPIYGMQATLRIADFQTNGKITLFNGNSYGNGYYPIWFPCTRINDEGILRIISTAVYLKAKNTFNFLSSSIGQYVYTSTGSQVRLGYSNYRATIDFPSSSTLDVDSTKFDKVGDWSSVTSPVYGNWALSFMDTQGNFSPLNWVGDSSETATHLGIQLPLSMLDVKVWSGHGLDVNWGAGLYVTNPVPSTSGASIGDVLSVGSSGLEWVAPGGGSSYSAGSGISIANDTISAKVDGSSITVNTSGELQATASSLQTKPLVAGTGITLTASASDVTISADSQLPSYSSADSGKSLVVNGNGDGVIWDRKISGVMYNGASSSELRHIRLNTYNNPSTPGLVAAFPAGAQGVSCGFLMPDPGFVADETVDKVARVIENPNNSGVCMLAYQDDAAVISPLEKYTITTSTNPYEVDVQPGKWYEIVCSQSTAQTWNIYLEANSLVTTNTVHTIVRITRTDASVSCSPSLVWHDERGIIHYEQCDLTGTTSYYDFDCLVRKNGYTVEGIPWSFARVRRI